MKRTIRFCILLFAFCIFLTACSNECEHTYFSDCDEACDKCGEVREITAEHNYYGDCDKSCHSCGKEREAVAEHSWKPATCTTPESCEGCGAVKDGELIEHSYTAKGYDDHYHYQRCSVCEKPDENSKEKHVLNDEYACECGMKYTAETENGAEISVIVKLYNSSYELIKEYTYVNRELMFSYEYYYDENENVIKKTEKDPSGNVTVTEYN